MITRPKLEHFRKGDLVQYFNNVLETLSTERATTLKVSEQQTALSQIMERFNASWQPNKGSELTPQIQKLDEQRDSLFMGLKLTLDAWANHHYTEEKKNAAFLLADKINAHGNRIDKLRYQQETATINALLSDFSDELKNEITLLGLNEWVAKLQEVNTTFNTKYMERAKALSTEQEGVVLQLRTESTEAYQQLMNIFEARMAIAKVEGEDSSLYETVQNELNELTDQYNEAVQGKSSQSNIEETIN